MRIATTRPVKTITAAIKRLGIEHLVEEIDHEKDNGYWIYLTERGWSTSMDCRTIHEDTQAEVVDQLTSVIAVADCIICKQRPVNQHEGERCHICEQNHKKIQANFPDTCQTQEEARVEEYNRRVTLATVKRPAPPVSELQHHGSDMPICPCCSHNNAMLGPSMNWITGKMDVFECRDCKYLCAATKFHDLDAPKPIEIKTLLEPNRSFPGNARLVCDKILVNLGGYDRYKIGGVPKGCEGRKVDGGELVPGPWHYIFGLASVIDNHGGTGAEMKTARDQGRVIEVVDGSKLVIDGLAYTVKKSWNGVLELVDSKEVDRA